MESFQGVEFGRCSSEVRLPRRLAAPGAPARHVRLTLHRGTVLLWHTQKLRATLTVLLIYLASGVLVLTHGSLTQEPTYQRETDFCGKFLENNLP